MPATANIISTTRTPAAPAFYQAAQVHFDQLVTKLQSKAAQDKTLHRPCRSSVRARNKSAFGPASNIRQAFEEATRRDPQHRKRWCALVDGNELQLGLLECAAEQYKADLTIVLDVIHVIEYLWKAAWALHPERDPAAEQWVSQHLLEILHGNSSLVAAGIRRSATLRDLTAKQRQPLDKCADYLLKYREYLHYDRYLAAGLPIATCVIEGACRYLVKDRMKKTGARWSLDGAEAVLRLRALKASGDLDQYWEFHLQQEYECQYKIQYAAGKVPALEPLPNSSGKGFHLRLVKR